MAKKVQPQEAPVEVPQVKLTSVQENVDMDPAKDLEIPGYAFRWINAANRTARHTWRHWRAVERDSELGKRVKELLPGEHDRFAGMNTDTNYFYFGSQSVLAYATKENSEAHKKAMSEKATNQLRKVVGDKDIEMQQVIVPTDMVKKTRDEE